MAEITYSHRNGESEPPTEDGYFWYIEDENTPLPHDDLLGVFYVLEGGDCVIAFGHVRHISELPGRWWGPVTSPWGDTNG